MTRLYNDAKEFGAEALAGFVAAHPAHVQPTHGGVVRAEASPAGQVAVVVGGGGGHYPAFAGWVGRGMAHGAACGNVFASPSASQISSVARASDNGGGVLFLFGNYAGDVLHFNEAATSLRREGVDVRVVAISDDIASDEPARHLERRGIAGDVVVVKIGGAAAEAGLTLDEVERAARRANERTRTIGVAFSGCTLPGAGAAQFTVPSGQMAFGLGIHGEPGISVVPLGTADEVAEMLVDRVLAEEPMRGKGGYEGRVAAVLNGLGSTKYEELYVVFRRAAELLERRGLTLVEPEVGEHVTSLDMAGLSLTLTYLDPELEELWTAPVDAPALRKGHSGPARPRRAVTTSESAHAGASVHNASVESRAAARAVVVALEEMVREARAREVEWARLDSVAGDGDHGQGMTLGTAAALDAAARAVASGAGVATTLGVAGEAWSEGAGGTSGALWGGALRTAATALSDASAVVPQDVLDAVELAVGAIVAVGGAKVGDKTMVDALVPFTTALRADYDGDLVAAWTGAASAARAAANETAQLVAHRGRARTHGEASIGHPDPGAVSFAALMVAAVRPWSVR